MELRTFTDPIEYRDCVTPFLMQKEAQNCLPLGIIDSLINRSDKKTSDAYLWAVVDQSGVVGVAWMTPPYPLGLTEMPPEALELVLQKAATIADRVGAVIGLKSIADTFKDRWMKKRKVPLRLTMEQRLYQLSKVTAPFQVPGAMRVVDEDDFELLVDWSQQFAIDCKLLNEVEQAKASAAPAIKNKSRYLWIVDGKPVAMVGAAGPTPSGIKISWVYTPPRWRGQGYASALVAALSQKYLDEGRTFCFLYTDLANPTSNSIYQKIGYEPVCDSVHHTFGPAQGN